MNPLYESLCNGQNVSAASPMTFQNPMQKANYILQAMQNPAAFVKQHFPDIPSEIENNPAMILNYLQRTRGISDQQIQQVQQMANGMRR